MSQLYRNTSYIKGVRYFGNYSLRAYLPKSRLTIPLGHKDKKKGKAVQSAVNEIEKNAIRYPDKDFTNDIYVSCSYQPKVDIPVYKFDRLFNRMIKGKVKDSVINSRTKEIIMGKKHKRSGLVIGGIYPLFIKGIFGRLDIRDITPAHKDMLLDKLDKGYLKSGARVKYSDASTNLVKRNMTTFLNWLVEEDYLDKVPFKMKQTKSKGMLTQNNWIKKSVFYEICSYAHFTDVAYFKVAYNTGLRLRELRTHIEDSSSIKCYHSIKRESGLYWIEVYGKGGKVAEIPLQEHIKADYDTMVANPKNPRTISANFKMACRLAGYEHFHFHNLRASFISNLAIVGTPAKVIKELARHSDLKITSSHYLGDKDMNKNILETWMKNQKNQ